VVVKMSVVVFWVMMLCGLVGGYQCFELMYHLHLQDEEKLEAIMFFQNVGNHL
jgi:hypothetical protein